MGIKGFRSWFESQFPDAILAFPKKEAHEQFDHVLIDMNQLLHISLRRSRSEGHALTILMKELDACCALATPRMSLVLAMDGPPSAAKLATQRRRRYSTLVRSKWKQAQLGRVRRSAFTKQDQAKRRRRYATETKTLCITPGTTFMEKAQQALLYWAWQRMQNPNNPLSRVRICISNSNVPGEGEVKLLDWILQKRDRKGESIAIIGGDSDLVLEGLVIPPSSSHNVFVLLPEGNRRYYAISLWETTRALARFLPRLDASQIMRVRTDLVLLLILNGNDYLPKLRGSSGFNKVFHTYLRLLHSWLDDRERHPQEPFLVDPDSLVFNLPFCVAFFRQLAQLAPSKYFEGDFAQQSFRMSRITPLGRLNDLVDSDFVPKPVRWTMVSSPDEEDELSIDDDNSRESTDDDDDDDDDDDEEMETNNESEEDTPGEQILMRLTLGRRGTDDFYQYEIWHDVGVQLKKSKHKLALMALDDLMGTDYYNEVVGENEDDEEDGYSGITTNGYSWEVQYAVPGKVDKYLAGLLWNLQTYQDGVCADYAYNYGRRMSPTAGEIVDFFKEAIRENRTVGREELLGDNFTPAISAGLSCLAALPSQVRDLIPEPYNWLSNTTVEDIYASCMDPEDNCFDMPQFERACEDRIKELAEELDTDIESSDVEIQKYGRHGRRILTGDHYWLVLSRSKSPLSHPFDPPPPFSERLSELRPNRRLKVSRSMATAEPRPRSHQNQEPAGDRISHMSRHQPREVKHADVGDLLQVTSNGKNVSILDVDYKRAYQEYQQPDRKTKRGRKMKFELAQLPEVPVEANGERPKKHRKRRDFDAAARMREFKVQPPPRKVLTNAEGYTALLLLKQLQDARLIGDVDWNYTIPSMSSYASVDPSAHECVQLIVRKGTDKHRAVLLEDLTYVQDRDANHVSRQSLRQHLSSFALCDILGPEKRWSGMKLKEIKGHLLRKKSQSKKS